MNKQVNYIIYALLLSLILPIGYFFIYRIISSENNNQRTEVFTKYIEKGIINNNNSAYLGKNLFQSKCASCHQVFKNSTGPALLGFEERGPWSNREKIYEWVKSPNSFMMKDMYTKKLKKEFGSLMQAFPDIKNEEVDAIIDYINFSSQQRSYPVAME